MPRSFSLAVDSPVSVEQVHTTLGDKTYWLARIAEFGGNSSTLESLSVDFEHTVRVTVTQDLRHDVLPGILTKFYRRDLDITHTEVWRPEADGELHGQIGVAVSGAPGSGTGTAIVAPTRSGSRMTFTATVEFKVPVDGGTIESYLAREFGRGIPEIQRFTARWITDHV
jgi:hypothetical protein